MCWCYGVVRLGWCGILIQAEALMSLALVFHYLLLNMFRMLVHPSSGTCDLMWIYFMCCTALVRCVLVLRCGSAGVVWYPSLILTVKYLGVSRFFLHVLLYHMDAAVLCSRLLMFLYSCMIFACLAFVNLKFIGQCIVF